MADGSRRGISLGCAVVLALGLLVAACVLVPMLHFVWSVAQMNLHRDDFAAFDHIPAGTPVAEVLDRATELGFKREPLLWARPDAGQPEAIGFQKVVVPPFGRWFIHITHFDGGVLSVRTSTLD